MEKIDIDLNSLFNLSYNFENLKLLLTKISKNQDIFESKLKGIEDKLNNYNINPTKEISVDKPEQTDKKLFDKSSIKISRDNHKYKTKIEKKSDYNYFNEKIEELEDKIRLLYNFIPKFPEDKTKTLNNILDEHQINIDNNNNNIKEMKDKVENMKDKLDEIIVKMNDLDIYDIVKDIQFSGGDIEASKILIQSVEKKMETRFKFMEEKIKDDEQLTQKIKNEIINMKNNYTIQKNSLTIVREKILKLENEVDSNKRNCLEKIKNNENEIESLKESESKNLESINNQFQNITMNLYDLSNKNGDTHNLIKDKDEETMAKKNEKDTIKDVIKEIVNDTEREKFEEKDKINISSQKIDESHFINVNSFNEYKDATQKKLNNFERRIQAIVAQIKNDYFQNEINSLKNALNNIKPTPKEFYNLSVQVQQYLDLYDGMKEENSNIQEEFKKIKDSVSNLLKNYENVILKAANKNMGNNNDNDISAKERITILSKFDDYLEISIFNDYIKEQTKFSEKIKKDFDSYRRFYDEIIETLKKAASVQDLKSLEEYLLDLFTEFKDKANRFYPKKSEINKNFKALELQIKQIYEYIIKKDENSENWLLAKKPIGGFSCASCESYLGDLKENNERVIWNQLPEREIITTNTNRIGNGFSRILNLVNISKDNNQNNKKENISPSNLLKPEYDSFKKEIFLKNNDLEETNNNNLDDKTYMNITMIKRGDEHKNIFKDFSGNNTKTNFTSKQKNSFSQEEKFRLTSNDNMNLFKELKDKKFKRGLPPISIIKDDSNIKDINYSSLFEEIKNGKEKEAIPKVMKIIRKKNK